jgi:signal transduction histidine kinase
MHRASDAWSATRPVGAGSGFGGSVDRVLHADLLRTLLAAAAVALAYGATARLGAVFGFPGAPASALWFPNAILLAALLLAQRRSWWIYLALVLGAHFLVLLPGTSNARAVIGYVGNCSTALLGALALAGILPATRRIDRLRSAVAFILVAGIVVPLGTSLLVAAAALAAGLHATYWWTVSARSLTNAFAILTLVPLILHAVAWLRAGDVRIHVARAAEASLLVIALATLGALAFVTPGPSKTLSAALLYAPFAILLWGTVRFGVPGACGSVLLLGVLATLGALNETGPFAGHSAADNTVALLLFLVITAGSLLLLAAVVEERSSLEQAGATMLSSLRRVESQHRQAEMLHSAVLASIHDQIGVLDQDGVIIETNPAWRRFVEHSASRPFERGSVGEHYLQACAAAAQAGDAVARELLECIRDVLGGVSVYRRLEFSRDAPQGLRWYEASIERLHRPEGGAVITRSDITGHKQAITQASEQRQQLAHLGRAAVLGELSGAFAHELAQPLTAILGNAEAALELLPPDAPGLSDIRDMLRDIIKDDVRAAEVIQRLRSMLTQGEIERHPVDLNQIVREVLAITRADLITRNISVSTQLDAQAALVLADPVQLQQVLLNLIVNAAEAMSASAPGQRQLTIATRLSDAGRWLECSVADRGCGIPPGDHERIFQPFVTTKKQGLGLGLAICRSIIEAHGGRLWAENAADGRGAMVRFTVVTSAQLDGA